MSFSHHHHDHDHHHHKHHHHHRPGLLPALGLFRPTPMVVVGTQPVLVQPAQPTAIIVQESLPPTTTVVIRR